MSERVAVVTGAGGGIGSDIVRRLAEDGCDVAMLDLHAENCRETEEFVHSMGRKCLALQVDVCNESAVAEAVGEVIKQLGCPRILVNNAGVMRSRRVHNLATEDWDLVMDVNLKGAFLMCRELIPHMRQTTWGRIINVSSMGALGLAGSSNYAAAKAGIQGFTKSLALELGRYNITANAVAPGFVITDMTRDMAAKMGQSVEEVAATMVAEVPVGRVGTGADIAHVVAFFADQRSSYISGQILYATGGPKG